MKDHYKLNGPLVKMEVQLEKEVAEQLVAMEEHSRFSRSELTNTALKRFISQHKDFSPPAPPKR